MTSHTRYKLTIIVMVFLALLCIISTFKGMEALAVCCVTGIMTTLSTYVWSQTKRPSQKQKEQ